jgi:hypothetical protein
MSSNDATKQVVQQHGMTVYKMLSLSSNTSYLVSAEAFIWQPHKTMRALCQAWRHDTKASCERPVTKGCTCGIYAARSVADLERLSYAPVRAPHGRFWTHVVVELEMWGRIELGTIALRGEYARIRKIQMRYSKESEEHALERAFALEELYGVDVVTFEVELGSMPPSQASYTPQLTYEELEIAYRAKDLSDEMNEFVRREYKKRTYQRMQRMKQRVVNTKKALADFELQLIGLRARYDGI